MIRGEIIRKINIFGHYIYSQTSRTAQFEEKIIVFGKNLGVQVIILSQVKRGKFLLKTENHVKSYWAIEGHQELIFLSLIEA